MKKYETHLIECQCILPIYKNHTKPVYHKFPVFSEIDESNNLVEKYVACNNCDCIHLVKEISSSELVWGKDYYKSFINTISDIKFNLISEEQENLVNILEQNNCDISTWEKAYFLLENEIEDDIIISKKDAEAFFIVKVLKKKNNKFILKTERYQKEFDLN